MTIEAVVFDVGETLVDETRVWSLWAEHLGVPPLTLFAALGGVIARGIQHPGALELFRPGIDVRAEVAAMRAAGHDPFPRPEDLYPDALPCLRALADRGYRLGVAGNQPVEAAAAIRAFGVELELVATSDGWGVAKPDPRFFARIAGELALQPASIAYVGDRVDNDVIPAREAGMTAVFLRRGPWAWIQAGRDGPEAASIVIERLTDLPEALESLR